MDAMRRFLALLAFALAAPAASQGGLANSALANHDTRAPIDIDAARIEVRDRENQAILSGNVRVKQAALTLNAGQLRVFYERGSSSNPVVMRIDAEDGVTLTSPSERVQSAYAVYDVEDRQITMIGSVVLTRGDSMLRGQRLAIDLENGRSTLDGAATGANGGTRVTGRFVVPERRADR